MRSGRRTRSSRIGCAIVLVGALLLGQGSPSSAAPVEAAPARSAAAAVPYPDGTFVKTQNDARVYVLAGGEPVYVDSFAPFGGGPSGITTIDEYYIRSASAPPDGTFLATAGEGRVYRMVGGAPVYIDSWAPFGGQQPFAWVSPRALREAGTGNWSNLRSVPQDGTQIMTLGDGRVYRFAGASPVYIDSLSGIQDGRATITVTRNAVSSAGSGPWSTLRGVPADGTAVRIGPETFTFVGGALLKGQRHEQGLAILSPNLKTLIGSGPWSHLRRFPSDGSLVATQGDGRVYQIVGGAPIYVDSWAAIGGYRPFTWVPREAVYPTRSYSYDRWGLNDFPADGAFVATHGEGRVYQLIGGAPVWVESWASVGGVKPYTWVSRQAIAGAGTDPWFNLRRSPHDAFIATTGDGRVYQMVNGSPIYLASWDHAGGVKPFVWVSPGVVSQAGTGLYGNLSATPPNGTDVRAGGRAYRFADGAPVPTGAWANDESVLQLATPPESYGSGPWSHLASTPRDGTFVAGIDQRVYRFAGGSPIYVDSWAPFGGPQPFTYMPPYFHEGSKPPVDGTFVSTTDGRIYVYAGGAPFYVVDWADYGGPQPYTMVSSGAIDSVGTGSWSRLPRTPTTPIILKEARGDNYYRMVGGAPLWLEPGWQDPRLPTDWRSSAQPVSAAVLATSDPRWANVRLSPVDGTWLRNGTTYYQIIDGRLQIVPTPTQSLTSPLVWVSAAFIAGVGTGRWSAILPPQ